MFTMKVSWPLTSTSRLQLPSISAGRGDEEGREEEEGEGRSSFNRVFKTVEAVQVFQGI